ncbi:Endonuclease/exonuclease/phosphatase [Dillenia turbinata]|uniref:Endonuclease/exonuclease/phosphatase n=1 Tax=Dillenia turbinata TaxID=194707 RepID=A0AAN8VYS7_9MAGN
MSMTSKAEEEAGQKLKGFGSWPDLTALHEHEGVIHREGIEWMKVGSSQTYVPSVDDFGHRLRLESVVIDFASHGPLSPVNFMVIDPVITAPAPCPRCMIQIGHVKKYSDTIFSGQTSKAKNFSVLSYNILSDLYVSNDRYAYCPSWALSWEYRRRNLLGEITGYGADILCLQEVQSDHFENFFKPELEKHGYSGVYKKKTNMVYTGSQYVIDGCAIFFQKNRFKEVGSYEIKYDKQASSIVELLEPERRMEARNRLMKDNVAVIVVLETVIDRVPDAFLSKICVVLILPFKVSNLVNVLESIIVQSQIPLVICGDLNSLPRSEPYDLLVTRGVYSVKEDPYSIAPHLRLQHSIPLGSAYSSLLDSRVIEDRYKKPMDTQNKEPFFTNFTPKFSGTLDYIFYTVWNFGHKAINSLNLLRSVLEDRRMIAQLREEFLMVNNLHRRGLILVALKDLRMADGAVKPEVFRNKNKKMAFSNTDSSNINIFRAFVKVHGNLMLNSQSQGVEPSFLEMICKQPEKLSPIKANFISFEFGLESWREMKRTWDLMFQESEGWKEGTKKISTVLPCREVHAFDSGNTVVKTIGKRQFGVNRVNLLSLGGFSWETVDKLQVEGLLELLDSENLGSGLPSPLWSSDHIALMARFSFKPPLGREFDWLELEAIDTSGTNNRHYMQIDLKSSYHYRSLFSHDSLPGFICTSEIISWRFNLVTEAMNGTHSVPTLCRLCVSFPGFCMLVVSLSTHDHRHSCVVAASSHCMVNRDLHNITESNSIIFRIFSAETSIGGRKRSNLINSHTKYGSLRFSQGIQILNQNPVLAPKKEKVEIRPFITHCVHP